MSKFKEYLEAISPSFIIITDHEELDKIFDWAKKQGKNTGTLREKLLEKKKFPLYISVDGDTVGWTDKGDRAAKYTPFDKWWIIK